MNFWVSISVLAYPPELLEELPPLELLEDELELLPPEEELDEELEEDELLLDEEELLQPELLEDEELLLDELELDELEDEELLEDVPFKIYKSSEGRFENNEPSILVPGEYLLIDFKNLSCATKF